MTIEQGIVDQFAVDLFGGVHDFSLDTFKVALYLPTATLSPASTTAYAATGESSGTGYTAGGEDAAIVAGFPKVVGSKFQVDFEDVTFTSVTLSARGALVYNDTAAGKPAVMIIDFGSLLVPAAQNVRVRMPDPSSMGAALEMQIQRG